MLADIEVTKVLDHDVEVPDVDSREGLLAALDLVDCHGWDSAAGRTVLEYARAHVVRPAACSVGFTGSDLGFAEATGWDVAWELLAGTAVRDAASPWGVVWSGVRRALVGERLADMYATSPWVARRVCRHRDHPFPVDGSRPHGEWSGVADLGALAEPVSLSLLAEQGHEPSAPAVGDEPTLGERLDLITELLVSHGWVRDQAYVIVEHVAHSAVGNGTGSREAPGWRRLAAALDLPLWQARRVTVLILGAPGWPGLVEQLVTAGPCALDDPAVHSAVRATLDQGMRPVARVALAAARSRSREDRLAS
jgi:hypothetical protein